MRPDLEILERAEASPVVVYRRRAQRPKADPSPVPGRCKACDDGKPCVRHDSLFAELRC